MAACASRLRMPPCFMRWCRRTAWKIQRWCWPALRRGASLSTQGVNRLPAGAFSRRHLALPITTDSKATISGRRPTHHAGEFKLQQLVLVTKYQQTLRQRDLRFWQDARQRPPEKTMIRVPTNFARRRAIQLSLIFSTMTARRSPSSSAAAIQ
jgi:hypothetical protein